MRVRDMSRWLVETRTPVPWGYAVGWLVIYLCIALVLATLDDVPLIALSLGGVLVTVVLVLASRGRPCMLTWLLLCLPATALLAYFTVMTLHVLPGLFLPLSTGGPQDLLFPFFVWPLLAFAIYLAYSGRPRPVIRPAS